MPELRQERLPRSAPGDVRRAGYAGAGHHKGSGTQDRNAVWRPLRRMPLQVAYEYRARTYPWAVSALKAAEAVHGAPEPGRPGRPRKDGTAPEPKPRPLQPERCGKCSYLTASVGHLIQCGGQS
jgi:hypothetical protein